MDATKENTPVREITRRGIINWGSSEKESPHPESKKYPFKVVVITPEEEVSNIGLWPGISFANLTDKRALEPLPPAPLSETHSVSYHRQTQDPHPLRVDAVYPISSTPQIDKQDFGRTVMELYIIPRGLLYTGMAMIHTISRSWNKADKMSRRTFLTLGVTAAIVGLTESIAPGFYALSPDTLDRAAYFYKTKAQVSSIRAMLFMYETWKQHPELQRLPVVAVSWSKMDGLEQMAQENPEILKRRLLLLEYHPVLIESVKRLGSVEALFTYSVRDRHTGEVTYHILEDRELLNRVAQITSPYLPKPHRPGEVSA